MSYSIINCYQKPSFFLNKDPPKQGKQKRKKRQTNKDRLKKKKGTKIRLRNLPKNIYYSFFKDTYKFIQITLNVKYTSTLCNILLLMVYH